ncbi:MAG: FkbM family methyltransferase [Nitrososphaerota archaeon]|nr:FkbM family methyltransferase [Nitrososphaerota archaeon]
MKLTLYNIRLALTVFASFTNWTDILAQLSRSNGKALITMIHRKSGIQLSCCKSCFFYILGLAKTGSLRSIETIDNTVLINGVSFPVDEEQFINNKYRALLMENGWSVSEGLISSPTGIRFPYSSDLRNVYEIFVEKIYDVNCKGRDVVDIGASIGDTPMFFASKGARVIYAFEPVKQAFDAALENFRINGVTNVILVNAPIASDKMDFSVPKSVSLFESASVALQPHQSETGEDMELFESIPLREVVEHLEDPYLLKIDCEGCEYDLITNSYPSIRLFENVIFECHPVIVGKSYKRLIRMLREDFEVTIRRYDGISPNIVSLIICKKRHPSH